MIVDEPLKTRNVLEALAGRPAPGGSAAVCRPGAAAADGSILVVEDSEANRVIAESILTRAGYTVRVAGDGAAGLEAARTGGIDLVLMDLQMPVMGGEEATRLIRDINSKVPIVALSAQLSAERGQELLDEGFSDVLQKPYSSPALLDAIRRACYPSSPA